MTYKRNLGTPSCVNHYCTSPHRRCTLKHGMLCYKWCALAKLASFIYIKHTTHTHTHTHPRVYARSFHIYRYYNSGRAVRDWCVCACDGIDGRWFAVGEYWRRGYRARGYLYYTTPYT